MQRSQFSGTNRGVGNYSKVVQKIEKQGFLHNVVAFLHKYAYNGVIVIKMVAWRDTQED